MVFFAPKILFEGGRYASLRSTVYNMKRTLTLILTTLLAITLFTACEPGDNGSSCNGNRYAGPECFVDTDELMNLATVTETSYTWNKADLTKFGQIGTNEAFNLKRTINGVCWSYSPSNGKEMFDYGSETSSSITCFHVASPDGTDTRLSTVLNNHFGSQGLGF